MDSNQPEPAFDVFISYSRRDADFARRLERTLESYQPPADLPVPQRHLQVFRDEADFTGVEYFQAVDKHVREAAKLLVVCSPRARQSPYVNDEIRRFARYKSALEIIPILIDGLPNNEAGQAQEERKAFPEALVELLEMPRAIEYRSFDCRRDRLDREAFSASWFSLLAEVYGLSRDIIEQREKKRRIRRRRTVISIVTGVMVALSAALIWALISRREAIQQRNTALARQLAAQAQIIIAREPYLMERAALLGAESLHRLQTPEGDQVVRAAIDLLPRRVAEIPYAGDVTTAALSPAGEYAAVSGDKGVDVFDCLHQRQLSHVAGDSVVFSTVISPDGKWLIAGQMNGKVAIFGLPGGRPYRQLQADAQVTNLAITPDGEHVAARSSSSTVNIWSLRDTRETVSLTHGGIVQSIAFTPDDRQLCVGTRNNLVYVWNWSSGKLLQQMKAEGPVYGIACGASGEVVAAVGNREVQVWGRTPAQTGILPYQYSVRMVAFSPDSQYLATAGEHRVEVWKTQGWSRIAQLEHQNTIEAIVFHPRRPLLATASDDRTARIWDIPSGSEVARVSHQEAVLDVNFDREGRRMVTASNDHSARIVEVPADSALAWESGKPTAADFDALGERIATGDFYGSVRLWNVQSRQLVRTVVVFKNQEITAVRFSPDERYLAVGARSGAASIVDLSSGQQVSHFDHGAWVKSIVMEAGHHWTFTGGVDAKVKIWSPDGRLLETLDQGDPVTALALSSDGRRLAVTTGRFGDHPRGGFAVWNVLTRTVLRRVESLPVSFEAISFDVHSRIIATAGQDKRARLWDAASGRERLQMAFDQPVWAVDLAADGKYLATGSEDGVARVWDTTTGRELVRLPHVGAVRIVRFTRDGKHVLTASFDASGVLTQAREWEWQASDLIQQVCSRVAGGLTQDDWSRYVAIEAYHPICPVKTR
jgi:WD40 repeat protein